MNSQRRSQLVIIKAALRPRVSELEELAEQEAEAHENMPEGIQDSEKGEKMLSNIEALEEAAADLQEIIDRIDEIE